jgi:integrase
MQFEGERLVPLRAYFGEKPLLRFKAEDLTGYQNARLKKGISNRMVNMETGVLRRMLKRAKVWNTIAEDVKPLPEHSSNVGRVLTGDQKRTLFEAAASKPQWEVACCAAVFAVSTTCRGIEVKNIHWRDVDLFSRVVTIRRSKTTAGLRPIPLNRDAMAALGRLLLRAQALGSSEPDHYVFPACEHQIDPMKPQKSFRTSWRKLTIAAGLPGFRSHDLRHQAITEMAEAGATDATMTAVAGQMSKKMIEHYSHVRMAAKRTVLDSMECGLMGGFSTESQPAVAKAN